MIVTIRRRWLLRLFWGKRDSYPTYVSAAPRAWIRWLKQRGDRVGKKT